MEVGIKLFFVSDLLLITASNGTPSITNTITKPIKEVTVEIFNSPSSETQNTLNAILEELRMIRTQLEGKSDTNQSIPKHLKDTDMEAA